ncbi:serine/threonine-protein kinase [Amycolatopsis echigonensis]|uniref:non-specific serine/threonine protein kinase n=1 Tax=Amycolatopsis echigonensis TaxID=2576905 RepID=A0A2N3WIL4_9PSEU|nr:serine/threonine-protein kinase [Amycolatopsis niigatensis]PKV93715.1 serine/threonine-protein kinase [Amycolatopsis niigatensis]
MTGDVSGDLTGRQLGHYRIDSVLGKGGMSVTYQATDTRLGRKVALKVIGDHLGADAEFRERFVDEARNTSAIDHANVVPLYDFGELDGMLYIAMRMVDGGDLAGLMSAGPISPSRALSLLDQVADALDTLHNHGLVHLDVKPANVLVTSRETSREHVYVADFGLTRRGATGHRTRGGDFLGSPTYAAPEHLRGEPLDGRTDQYALTCVLFACLTGTPPFRGDVPTVIKGHLGGEPPSVASVVALPAAVDDVIRKGMAKNPNDRYPSCVAMIAAARVALGSLATSDTPPGPARPNGLPEAGMQQGPGGTGGPGGSGSGAGGPAGQGGPGGPGAGPGGQPGAPGAAGQGGPGGGAPGAGSPGGQGVPGGWGTPQPGQAGYPAQGGYGGPAGYGNQPPPGYPAQPGQPHPGQQGYPGQAPAGPPPGYGYPGQPGQQPPQGPPPGYGGYPNQSGYPAQPTQQGHPNQAFGDPMRLRPPSPAGGAGAFETKPKSGGLKWLWIALGVLVVAGLVVGAIFLFGGDDKDNGGTAPTSSAPNIPVGPGGSKSAGPSSLRPPPSSIHIQPSH